MSDRVQSEDEAMEFSQVQGGATQDAQHEAGTGAVQTTADALKSPDSAVIAGNALKSPDNSVIAAEAPDKTVSATRPLLTNRKYLFLMSAQAISNLGDWLYILALFVIVGFRWHGSPITISLMMLSLTGPMVLLGPFTGMLADRWNRTAIMMVSNIVMAVLVGVIPWLPQRWMLFAILVLVGVFESLFSPAESGKLKEIVPDSQMQQAASINSSIMQLTKIIGPGASGFLVGAFGSMSAFWVDSISFLLSTLLLVFTGFRAAVLRAPSGQAGVSVDGPSDSPTDAATNDLVNPATDSSVRDPGTLTAGSAIDAARSAADITGSSPDEPAKEGGWQRFKEGLQHIRRVRILWTGTLILTLALLVVQLTDAQIVTLLRLIPNASSRLLGIIMGLSGGGGLIAALLVGIIKWKSAIRLMAIGTTGMGVGLGTTALIALHESQAGAITPFWMVVITIMSIVIGLCAGITFIPFQAAAQKSTPVELTGRVFGVIGSATTAAALLGPAIGGVLVTLIGVVNAYESSGVLLFILGVATLIFRRWLEGNTPVMADVASDEVSANAPEAAN